LSVKFTPISIVLFFAISFFACDKKEPVAPQNSPPILSHLAVPDTIDIGSGENDIISVQCDDPDGLADVDSVFYQILYQNGSVRTTGVLFDDGDYANHGDITPKNGKYAARIGQSLAPGNYRLKVGAADKSGERSNELESEFFARKAVVNNSPVLTEIFVSDTVFVDEAAPFIIQVKAVDPDPDDAVARVTFQILDPTFTEVLISGDLYDDGTHGDTAAGDSIFSVEITSAFASWRFGNFNLYVQGFDKSSKGSISLYKSIPWGKKQLGEPPIISDLSAPDTLKLPADSLHVVQFVLSVKADDPDNPHDVKEVFFDTYKPDGTISKSSPLQMYDNGASGDAVAGDQVYSLRAFLVYNNDVGNYRFEFQARDYSDLLSNKITHIITVIK